MKTTFKHMKPTHWITRKVNRWLYGLIELPLRRRLRSEVRDLFLSFPMSQWQAQTKEDLADILRPIIKSQFDPMLNPAVLMLLLKLAVELIWYWLNNNIENPPMTYVTEEPGY